MLVKRILGGLIEWVSKDRDRSNQETSVCISAGVKGILGFLNLPTMQETRVQSLGWEDPQEKGTATRSSILAWRISRTEEPGGLQSTESQRV